MQVLLDEDVPIQVLQPLRRVLRGHNVQHVINRGWDGKKDLVLLQHIASSGYDVFVTNDRGQLTDPIESRAVQRSGVHHVLYKQKVKGLRGTALAVAAIIAAMPRLIDELEDVSSQRLVSIRAIRDEKRYEITDPQRNPPRYWPR